MAETVKRGRGRPRKVTQALPLDAGVIPFTKGLEGKITKVNVVGATVADATEYSILDEQNNIIENVSRSEWLTYHESDRDIVKHEHVAFLCVMALYVGSGGEAFHISVQNKNDNATLAEVDVETLKEAEDYFAVLKDAAKQSFRFRFTIPLIKVTVALGYNEDIIREISLRYSMNKLAKHTEEKYK